MINNQGRNLSSARGINTVREKHSNNTLVSRGKKYEMLFRTKKVVLSLFFFYIYSFLVHTQITKWVSESLVHLSLWVSILWKLDKTSWTYSSSRRKPKNVRINHKVLENQGFNRLSGQYRPDYTSKCTKLTGALPIRFRSDNFQTPVCTKEKSLYNEANFSAEKNVKMFRSGYIFRRRHT